MTAVLCEVADGILTVTMNRPDVLNALNPDLLRGLAAAWKEASRPEVRAVVLTGTGRGFCAGQDLRPAGAGSSAGAGISGRDTIRDAYNPVILELAAVDKPVIAAVNGPAAGAGLSLACAADIRIASERAVFVPAFSRLGLVPDAGGSYFIPRLIGYSRAFRWLSTGDKMSAAQAREAGLVDDVVGHEALLPAAIELAGRLAAPPGLGVALTKRLLCQSGRASLADQLEAEARAQDVARAHPEQIAARAGLTARLAGEG
jgi:2-(1,2-epoxy-1,2-dihydrophenyl)acetyl-CoA isomerase